jgi:cytosine/adenosine deaminase-related metal-dependent hydrolase
VAGHAADEASVNTTRGIVNGHHHLYSALARGMPSPPKTPTSFPEILEQVWWRLDRALDLEMIRWSARLGALEALEHGTTAIIDHHSSPNAIEGSLDVIASACAEVGVRVACCYEVTDRNGIDGTKAGLAENERFLRGGGSGFVGAHACFTLSDDTLDAVCGLAADLQAGVHIHVAEGEVDSDAGQRLEHRADERWLLAHCVHLDRALPGTVAHNPRSNLHNGVGYGHPARFDRVVLGTDGIGSDLLGEFALAFVLQRAQDIVVTPEQAWSWLAAGADVMPGVTDDVVTWSYEPIDPWHVAYTPGIRPVRVEIGGEVVLDEGGPTRVDPVEIRARAREQAQRLFRRMEELG